MKILKELWSKDIDDPQVKSTYQYVVDLRNRLESVCDIAKDNLQKAARKQKLQYDKRAKYRELKVGGKALVLLPTKPNKLLLQWKGPYRVVEKFGTNDYKIQVGNKLKSIHANLLKQYVEREEKAENVWGMISVAVLETNQYDEESLKDDSDDLLTTPGVDRFETPNDVQISGDLNNTQKLEVSELLMEFPDVFTDKPGLTNLITHEIKTTTETPVRLKPYPLPYAMENVVSDEIDKMLKMDIIEPSEMVHFLHQ